MVRCMLFVVGPLVLTLSSLTTAQVPTWTPHQPGWTPLQPQAPAPGPGPAPLVPTQSYWGKDVCTPIANCRTIGVLPCVLGGGCGSNLGLFAFWCDGPALVVEECSGCWAWGVECFDTISGTPDCGREVTAPCLCNGTLGSPVFTGLVCQRPTCHY